ncbi:MAG: tryptophan--tRNA ligase [bacterium]|nr:tryptophan--tRNA ligase [bacterium]
MAIHKRILTGDRPTGRLHLGHYVGSLLSRVTMQDEYEQFVLVADVQALTDNADNPQKVRDNLYEVVLDNLACGVDPTKSTIVIQSLVPEIAELTIFFLNLVTVARLERNPTVKDEMRQKGYGTGVPAGFLTYPVSQTADILAFRANTVPAGDDQKPMVEQANEIGEKFNSLYSEVFPYVNHVASNSPRLPGIDGGAKMGKSLGNAIYLSDEPEIVKEKVMSMFTDPNHVRVEDPGKVGGNSVFAYLDVFDTEKAEVESLKKQYMAGGLGDVVLKQRLFTVLNDTLAPIRERRAQLATDMDSVIEIVREGTEKARIEAKETMRLVRNAMGINYFN